MNNEKNQIIKSIIFYGLISFIISGFRIEVAMKYLSKESIDSARIMAYSYSIIACIIAVLIDGILLLVVKRIFWGDQIVSEENFSDAGSNFIKALILNEIFKFGLIWIFLVDEAKYLPFDENIQKNLENTAYYKISKISDIVFICFAASLYAYTLKKEEKNINNARLTISAISLAIISLLMVIW